MVQQKPKKPAAQSDEWMAGALFSSGDVRLRHCVSLLLSLWSCHLSEFLSDVRDLAVDSPSYASSPIRERLLPSPGEVLPLFYGTGWEWIRLLQPCVLPFERKDTPVRRAGTMFVGDMILAVALGIVVIDVTVD